MHVEVMHGHAASNRASPGAHAHAIPRHGRMLRVLLPSHSGRMLRVLPAALSQVDMNDEDIIQQAMDVVPLLMQTALQLGEAGGASRTRLCRSVCRATSSHRSRFFTSRALLCNSRAY